MVINKKHFLLLFTNTTYVCYLLVLLVQYVVPVVEYFCVLVNLSRQKLDDGAKTGNPHTEIICERATDLSSCRECSEDSGCVRIVGYQEACTRESGAPNGGGNEKTSCT